MILRKKKLSALLIISPLSIIGLLALAAAVAWLISTHKAEKQVVQSVGIFNRSPVASGMKRSEYRRCYQVDVRAILMSKKYECLVTLQFSGSSDSHPASKLDELERLFTASGWTLAPLGFDSEAKRWTETQNDTPLLPQRRFIYTDGNPVEGESFSIPPSEDHRALKSYRDVPGGLQEAAVSTAPGDYTYGIQLVAPYWTPLKLLITP